MPMSYFKSNQSQKLSSLKNRSGIAVSFVNNALSSNAYSSPCSRLAKSIENSAHGESYRQMDLGYYRLSQIACHVSSRESAFFLIGLAYGSVDNFFKLLEAQRNDLRNYAYACLYKRKYLKGLFLLLIEKLAIRWGKKFLMEYQNLNNRQWW